MIEAKWYKFIEKAKEGVKELATEKTDLFLGLGGWIAPIGVAIATIIVYCINWAFYCYEIGYYHFWFSVPVSLIKEPEATIFSAKVVAVIIVIIVLMIFWLVGRWAYRKCKYLMVLAITYLIITVVILCPQIPVLMSMGIADGFSVLATLLSLSAYITVSINIFSICAVLAPTKEDKLARDKTESNMQKKRKEGKVCQKKKRSKNKQQENSIEDETKTEKQPEDSDLENIPQKVARAFLGNMVAVFLAVVVAGMPVCFSLGISDAVQNRELTLVLNQEEICAQIIEILAENCTINGVAIIYQNDNGALVSPCYITNNKAYVYTDCQQLIESDDLLLYTKTFDEIRPETVQVSFEEPTDDAAHVGNIK